MQTDTFRIREVSEFSFFHGFEYEDGKCWKVSESVGVRMSCYAALLLYRHTNFQRCAVRLPELRAQLLQSWIASLLAHVNWVMRSHAMWSQFASIFPNCSFNSRNCCSSSSSARLCSRRCFSQRPCLRRKHLTCYNKIKQVLVVVYLWYLMISYDFISRLWRHQIA